MMYEENDKAYVRGTIKSAPAFSHKTVGEDFYKMEVCAERSSRIKDAFYAIIPERTYDISKLTEGMQVGLTGQIRTYNEKADGEKKGHTYVFLFVQSVEEADGQYDDVNDIFLTGIICKEPVFRKTPKGREITDLTLAVNHANGRASYIPLICWGRDANFVKKLPVGSTVCAKGRLQSREYLKKTEDGGHESRTAYEVSAYQVEECSQEAPTLAFSMKRKSRASKMLEALRSLVESENEMVSEGKGEKIKLAAYEEAFAAAKTCLQARD